MQAIILVGGKGTRLNTLYPDLPKALVPVAGRPFIEWQIEWLAKGGVQHVHLAAGHKAVVLQEWAGWARFPGVEITLSQEPAPLGTAGGLKFVESFIQSDPFLVLNGDSLLPNLDFQALEKSGAFFPMLGKNPEKMSNVWTTLVVTEIQETARYGTVEFDASGLITAFREKANRSAGWINAGIYLMKKQVLSAIEAGKNLSIETDIFPSLAQQGRLRAFPTAPPLLDMGTPDGLQAMSRFLSAPSR